jgi:hypothetical protein
MLKDSDLPNVDEAKIQPTTQEEKQVSEADQVQPQAPEQAESSTVWQDRIKDEKQQREAEAQPALSEEEQRTAQSVFADPMLKAYEAQIREGGEIKHYGLVMSWAEHAIEHAAEWVQELGEEIVSEVKKSVENNWQEFITQQERERTRNPNKDDIDFDR